VAVNLIERSGEIELVQGLLEAGTAGRGSVCVIEGPAGVGKTALLDTCARRADQLGLRVLSARAGQLEGDLTWSVVRQLFQGVIAADEGDRAGLLAGAAGLAAGALGLEPGEEAGALHGLYWLTAALAGERPLLLAVDDAHWADLPSLGYLAYLATRASDFPVAVLATVRRGEPVPQPLEALLAVRDTRVVAVRELTLAGSGALVRAQLGANASDGFCRACHAATGGNPFLLRELVDELEREGVEPNAAQADAVRSITPETVRRTVLLRLSRLPETARELVIAAAILGDGAALADAAKLGGLDLGQAARAADMLAGRGILERAPTLGFVHALVREVIYEALPLHERSLRHGEAARLLAAGGASPERVAAQLLVSEPAGDQWAVQRLREAAGAALAAGAPATAADLLARALREPPDPAKRFGHLMELGRAELAAGLPGAGEHLRRAVEVSSQPLERAHALLDLGRALFLAGRLPEAAESFDRGLREAGDHDASLTALLQAAWLTVARTELPLRERATALLQAIAEEPPSVSSYGERALLAQVAGQLTFEGQQRERSLELARIAVGEGELIDQETSDGTAWLAAAGALGWGGDFDGFDRLHEHALANARRRGSAIGFASASYGLSFTRYYRGMLSAAIADAEQAIAAESEGWRHFLTAARAQLAWALIDQAQLDAASAALVRARSDPGFEQSTMKALVLEAEARIHLARGDGKRALQAALEAGQVARQALVPNPSLSPWRSRAAIAATLLEDRELAEQLLSEELTLARQFGAPHPIGVALMHSGLAHGEQGIDQLEDAVAVLAPSPARLEHARALVHLGAAHRRRGKITAARETLQAGLDASAACEATALERYARAELAAAGLRPRTKRLRGADALTPSERRVADLAISGMSNREIAQALFVSLRTVETHLTHSYQKLDINKREQLGAALSSPREP
jgi:DNA-binding CsgD family transcriptional regulator